MTPIGQPCVRGPITWLYFVLIQSVFVFVGQTLVLDALNAARLQASLASANAAPGGGSSGSNPGGGGDASGLEACCGAGSLPPTTILVSCFLLIISLFHYVGGPAVGPLYKLNPVDP
jgi:hypothetical protein